MPELPTLSPGVTVVWVLIGIIISLVLPVAVKTLHRSKGLEENQTSKPTLGQRLAAAWKTYGGNRYLAIAMAATVIAIVLVFLMGLEFSKPRDAALAGFAWESLVSKLLGGGQG
jgi:hypothetical protein